MFKVVGLIKRPEGMEFGAFKTWWLTEHAPKVQKWPGLVQYRINLCITPDQDFDGMAEVWFKTREEMDAIFSTPEGQTARGSASTGSGELSILLTEEHVIVE